MKTKKLVIVFFLVLFLVPCTLFTALYLYDPLYVFQKPQGELLYGGGTNQRVMNSVIIKNFDFDSAIIGNSYVANTSSNEAAQLFGGSFISVSADGSHLYDQSVVLDYILRHRKVKTIIKVLNEIGYKTGEGYPYNIDEYGFLYDDNPFNDVQIYLNKNYLTCLLSWSRSKKCSGKSIHRDRPNYWADNPIHSSRFGGIEQWIKHSDNEQIHDALIKEIPEAVSLSIPARKELPEDTKKEIIKAIDTYLVSPAIKYPKATFYYFFNPSSMLSKAVEAREGSMERHKFWVKQVVLQCSNLKNVKVYFFDNEEFTQQIKNYKDFTHYTPEINSFILNSMHNGYGLLLPENVDVSLEKFEQNIRDYDLKSINAYIQKELNSQAQMK